jgi:hypothetical protein
MNRETGTLVDFETFVSKIGNARENEAKFYLHWLVEQNEGLRQEEGKNECPRLF